MLLQKRNSCWLHCSLDADASQVASLVGVAARRRESHALSGAVAKTVETETFTTSAPNEASSLSGEESDTGDDDDRKVDDNYSSFDTLSD